MIKVNIVFIGATAMQYLFYKVLLYIILMINFLKMTVVEMYGNLC
jgi:hypothetical protein